MYILNLKLSQSKKFFTIFLIISVLLAVMCVVGLEKSLNGDKNTATCDEIGEYSLKIKNDSEIEDFLNKFGVKADISDIKREKVIIPHQFNQIYEDYNKLQQKIGLDLAKFKGEKAEKLTIAVDSDQADFAVLLLHDDKVIGGHLTTLEYGGKNLSLIG